ncbi:MAG: class I SAM-dependent methyltransferase [Acidimicrobiia bacterium]
MTEPTRGVIFGREADVYELSRPSYPAAALEHVRALVDARTAVEVGAGTGKATVGLARAGMSLTCIEPSPQMAEILRSKQLPGVEVVVSTFEEWQGAPASLDLIFAAQAWHWVDQRTAYRRSLELLRPRGAIALMWNIPLDRYAVFEHVYAEHAPELLSELDRRIHKRDSVTWSGDLELAGFTEVSRFTHIWGERVSAEGVRALYSTYSDHLLLPERQREALLDGLASAVRASGGSIEMEYRTEVFSGRKP